MSNYIILVLFWVCAWWLFSFWVKNSLSKLSWLSVVSFAQAYPQKAWLAQSYPFLLIVFIPLSIIGAARYFQSASPPTFFLFVILTPFTAVQSIKGLLEIVFGVSSYINLKRCQKQVIPLRIFRTSLSGLEMFEYQFACNGERIKLAGIMRLLVGIGLFSGLAYFLV